MGKFLYERGVICLNDFHNNPLIYNSIFWIYSFEYFFYEGVLVE